MKRQPVLVLDEGDRGDLGLVRSLGVAGIPVEIATHRPRGTTAASRYVSAVHPVPGPVAAAEERVEALRRIGRRKGGRPPVMMAGDSTLELVSEHRDALDDIFMHDLPALEVVRSCFHKDRFATESTSLGLPVPRTHAVRSAAEAAELAPDLDYPVFVKPFTKVEWGRLPDGVVEEQKGQHVETPAQLQALFEGLAPHGADVALVQRFVPSPDSEHWSVHAYVAPDGTFVGAFTTRKIRVWPPHRGVGSTVKSERQPELVDLSRSILEKLGYTGFALLQFKRDMEKGGFLLLEINCRFSTSGELAARCGANFPAASHAAMTGDALPGVSQREGPLWIDFERDRSTMEQYTASGEWTWGSYLWSLRNVRYPAFLALDDPRPFFRVVRNRLGARLRRSGRATDEHGDVGRPAERPAESQPA